MTELDSDITEVTGARKLIDRFGYWSEHPNHPVDDWQYEVAEGATRRSYWVWVWTQLPKAHKPEE